jgi:hypothetical protein
MSSITREEVKAMTDRELLSAYLFKTCPGFRDHSGPELMLRNGRWGTCVDCPRNTPQGVRIAPEHCKFTGRYDHNIHKTFQGKFYEYKGEISKSHLIDTILSDVEG